MKFRAVVFDLFGTVVQFAPRVPTMQVAGTQWRSTMGWLRPAVEELLPEIVFERLLEALLAVTEEIVRNRPPEYVEVPSRERFRRALLHLGIAPARAMELAERFSLAHMGHLASTVFLPDGHAELLADLSRSFALGLVSNFDHGPTARRLLDEHGVSKFFGSIVVSDGYGRRKPHPSIFLACLREIGVDAADALYVGDSMADDVVGAHAAGLRVAWIDARAEGASGREQPDYIVRRLVDLREVLA